MLIEAELSNEVKAPHRRRRCSPTPNPPVRHHPVPTPRFPDRPVRNSQGAEVTAPRFLRNRLQLRESGSAPTLASGAAPLTPQMTPYMGNLVSAPDGTRLCTWLRSPTSQRSSWMRIRLPAGSRKAQSRMPYGCSVGSWTTSAASLACSRPKVPSRSLVAKRIQP